MDTVVECILKSRKIEDENLVALDMEIGQLPHQGNKSTTYYKGQVPRLQC